jgi:hypothetical protein
MVRRDWLGKDILFPELPTKINVPLYERKAMKRAEQSVLRPTLDKREQQIWDDYEWCLSDSQVRDKYSGKVVVVHNRKIWGVGKDHAAALAAAQRKRGCPPQDRLALVVVPYAISEAVPKAN